MPTQDANAKSTLPALEIFRAGTHTDSRGRKITITKDELCESAQAYDPAVFAAPIVLGHPTMDAPAFGHLNKLGVADDGTMTAADHTDVHPEFAALYHDKRFSKWSVSFFQPDHPSNPKPGVYYPRHLGMLGAAAPAVPGLKAIAFAAADDQVVEFGEYDLGTMSALFRQLKNFLFARFGGTPEATTQINDALPEYMLNSLSLNAAEEAARANRALGFAAPTTTPLGDDMSAEQLAAAKAATDAANAERDAALAKAKAADERLAAAQYGQRCVQFAADADKLIAEFSLHPDERDDYIAFMAQSDDDATVSFAAADGAQKSFNAKAFLTDFIKRRGALLPKGERAAGKTTTGAAPVSFAAPEGVAVSAEGLERMARINAYAAEHKLDFAAAAIAVERQGG